MELVPTEIGGVPVRLDSASGAVLQDLVEGAHAPLEDYTLHRWAHAIALSLGFDELVSLPFLREVIPDDHQLAAVKTALNRMRDGPSWRTRLVSERPSNRRATTPMALTRRIARTVLVEPSSAEQSLYVELSHFLLDHYRRGLGISRMIVQTLQMELGSSPRAAAPHGHPRAARKGAAEPAMGHGRAVKFTRKIVPLIDTAARPGYILDYGNYPNSIRSRSI